MAHINSERYRQVLVATLVLGMALAVAFAFTVPVSAVDESTLDLTLSDAQPGATDVSHSWEVQLQSFEGDESLDRIELDYSGTGVDIDQGVVAGDFVVSLPDSGVLETTDVVVENNVVTVYVSGTVSSGNIVSITSSQVFTNPSEIGNYDASIQFFGDSTQSTVGTTQFSIGSGLAGTISAEDGTAIQDLLVDADGGPDTMTDANGEYSLNLEPGTAYDILFQKDGYVRFGLRDFSVSEGEIFELNEAIPGEMVLDPLTLDDNSPGTGGVEYRSLLTAQNPVTSIEYISINLSRAGDISFDQANDFTVVRNGALVESSVADIDGQRVLLDVFSMPDLAAGDEVEVTASGVTNPTEPGTYGLGVGFREGEGGTPDFPKTGGGSLFEIEAASGTVDLGKRITEDQDSIAVNVTFDNTANDNAYLVVENQGTGETTSQFVQSDGPVSIDVTDIGSISEGDAIEATLYETSDLVNTLDSDGLIVEADTDPTGTIALEDGITEDQSAIDVNVSFDNTAGDDAVLVMENLATGEGIQEIVGQDGVFSLNVTEFGGTSAGDEIEAILYETTDLATMLGNDSAVVESVPDPTGTIALEDGITEDQETIGLAVSFDNTAGDDAFVVVENRATGETFSTIVAQDGTLSVNAVDLGGITADDEIEATLYESNDLVTTLATDTAVVNAVETPDPTGTINFDAAITEDEATISLDVSFDNTAGGNAFLVLENLATGDSALVTAETDGTIGVDVADIGGTSAGDEIDATLYETNDLVTTLDSAQTTVETVEQPDPAGTVTLGDGIREDQETFAVGVTFENIDSVALEVANLQTGERVTQTVDSNGEIGISVGDIGGIDAGDEIEATLYRSTDLVEPLAMATAAVQAAPDPYFGADITEIPEQVTAGERIDATAGIVNIGDAESTQTVQFEVRNEAGDVVFEDSSTVTLQPDQVRTQSFSYTTTDGDVPQLTVTVSTADDGATVPVVVQEAEDDADDGDDEDGDDSDDEDRDNSDDEDGDENDEEDDETNEEVTVGEDQSRVNSTTRNVQAGEELSVNMPEPSEPQEYHMEQVNLTSSVDAEEVHINTTSSTEPLPDTPEGEFEFNGTTELGYLDAKSNLDNEEIDEVKFTFRIAEERVEALESGPEDVLLFRFDEETERWVPHDTEFVEKRGDDLVFQTFTDTFSDWTAAAQTPEMSITDTEVDVNVATTDEDINIQVFVSNTGGADGSYEAELLTNDEVVDREDATVPSNSTVIINFIRTFDQPGDYEIRVNDVPVGQLEISEEDEEVTVDSSPSEDEGDTQEETTDDDESDDGFGFGFGVIPAIAGLLVASFLITRVGRWSPEN